MTHLVSQTAPHRSAGGDRQWWETAYGRWRLAAELDAMRRFPGFALYRAADGILAWAGHLESSLGRSRYLVSVSYPPSFPDHSPLVLIEDPELPPETPHLLGTKRPCLYRSDEGPRHGYDPGRTTAATLVAWTALWIHAFETWRATGRWPGRQH
jgi:hypothetical protein